MPRYTKLHLRANAIPRISGSEWSSKTVCGRSIFDSDKGVLLKYANTMNEFLQPIAHYYEPRYQKCKVCSRQPEVGMELLNRQSRRKG